jgi:hypothetical protein
VSSQEIPLQKSPKKLWSFSKVFSDSPNADCRGSEVFSGPRKRNFAAEEFFPALRAPFAVVRSFLGLSDLRLSWRQSFLGPSDRRWPCRESFLGVSDLRLSWRQSFLGPSDLRWSCRESLLGVSDLPGRAGRISSESPTAVCRGRNAFPALRKNYGRGQKLFGLSEL